ncbi:MAG TPA: L-seryl-tRNA(Sec) selenium transferase [Kofleriaceae bacterium]|jgi:L-seryl-tRNA(Ser) seleniumtransferase|nr:L-seryl-tRNA(Sec) selenium transferase [Kofleriaceae bacterium]
MDDVRARQLASLPAVHVLADAVAALTGGGGPPRWAIVEAARRAIASRRAAILAGAGAGASGSAEPSDASRTAGSSELGGQAGSSEPSDASRTAGSSELRGQGGSAEPSAGVPAARVLSAGAPVDAIDPREVAAAAAVLIQPALRRVINATGVVLHTNLGRAPLAGAARAAIDAVAAGYSNLEYDLARGERGSRHDHLRELLRELTGAEDAIVVNNNAAATVLGLAALATDREIIVSRGELIEIGGSFRLPEILALSRGTLVEVGTTNKTHLRDYEAAIGPATGLLLKVHRSNFAIVGFTSEVAAADLVALGRARGLATMIDLGSGALVDRATQRRWGLPDEPTVAETVASGADLVTFSGDKLLGGPQAGIAVGRAAAIERARKHPLMRALRPDKLTLAGLAATLALYRDGALDAIPATRMLGATGDALRAQATALAAAIGAVPGLAIAVEPCTSAVGGGAMPTAALASWAVTVTGGPGGSRGVSGGASGGVSADAIDARLRGARVPVVGRIEDGRVWLDARTIAPDELADVAAAVQALVRTPG